MTGREYLMQFVLIFAFSQVFSVWWLINKYLDRRDRKRRQQSRKTLNSHQH